MRSLNSIVRSTLALPLLLPILLFAAFGRLHAAGQEPALTIEEVVRLTRSGFSEEIIVTKIKKNAKAFDLNGDELLDLKKEGVTDNVIKYLLDPSLPYTPPPPPSPAVVSSSSITVPAAAKHYPADPYANSVPAEPGLYFLSATAPVKVDLKFLLGTEEGKKLMKKGKTIGYLIGPNSKTRVENTMQTSYVRLPEGKDIEELVLVSLSDKNGRRELELGPSGPKQQLKAEDIRPRDALEVGPRLFKLTTQKLAPGEYLFLFIGSAEPAKGVFGKGYDFGVEGVADKKTGRKKGLI
jgi:hypothetical protein